MAINNLIETVKYTLTIGCWTTIVCTMACYNKEQNVGLYCCNNTGNDHGGGWEVLGGSPVLMESCHKKNNSKN